MPAIVDVIHVAVGLAVIVSSLTAFSSLTPV